MPLDTRTSDFLRLFDPSRTWEGLWPVAVAVRVVAKWDARNAGCVARSDIVRSSVVRPFAPAESPRRIVLILSLPRSESPNLGSIFTRGAPVVRDSLLVLAACVGILNMISGPAYGRSGPLDDYLGKEDSTYSWKLKKTEESAAGTLYEIALRSQTWRGIPWDHQFRIYEPKQYEHVDVMLLFITGGSSRSVRRPDDDAQAFALAQATGSRVAVLPQVPNQPLLGDRTEDDLIAHTFQEFLKSGEMDLPLLLPMVKSAVRAMDTAQQWAVEFGEPIKDFVVTGASKRGWTTWLTGAVDDRVVAIAPMVIPTLNMRANSENQLSLWGVYSEQIADYTDRGLTDTFDTEQGKILWEIVDPYFYLDRIQVPILQINGTNDPYWTHDSMRFYWDQIKSPKGVVYLPNAGHGLEKNRDYAINGVGALVRLVATDRSLPSLRWNTEGEEAIRFSVTTVSSGPEALAPKSGVFHVAQSSDRDFRDDLWEPQIVKSLHEDRGNGTSSGIFIDLMRPAQGSIAALADLTFEVDGLEFHLTTPIHEFRPNPTEDTNGGASGN